jgi:hypothetical protein
MLRATNLEGNSIHIIFKAVGVFNIVNVFMKSICNGWEHSQCKGTKMLHFRLEPLSLPVLPKF